MEKSNSIGEVSKALCAFQSELPILNLDREVKVRTKNGGEYSFRYATFKNIIDTVRPLLAKHKLSFTQLVEPDGSVTTMLLHESGEYISSTLLIKGEQTPQGIGSGITYAKRYSLSSILGIVADDDDDANIASGNHYQVSDNKKMWLNKGTKEWDAAIEYLKKEGQMDKIEKKYRINKANKEELLSLSF